MLTGERGGYVCRADVADVAVPVTVQAAIEARIDRLDTLAKQTLNAASVIGARFDAELLVALGVDAPSTTRCSRGHLRIAAEIRSRGVAPAPGGGDPRA